ncbi:cation diffusion facilitator family transporter [Methanosarcina hadiensis]|uniref:cation diffusion facilitator family transporter n=1 Tax=Methanosarcina hadiensis TaxID=3078083 RepID=UPI0039773245
MKADKNLNETLNISYKALFFSFASTFLKLTAGLSGNSTALIADSVRSSSGLINELRKLLEVFIASKPEDWSHNYGHGKIATLFMGAGAFILLFAGAQSISISLEELITFIQGKEIEAPEIFALYSAALILVSGEIIPLLGRKTGRYMNGISPEPDINTRKSQVRSLLLSCFVTLGIGCTFLPGENWVIIDSFIAILISLYLLGTSGKLLYGTTNELIEASLDEKENRKIREIINKTEGVTGSSELKTRKIGNGIAINACITVNDSLNIQEVTEITDRVEKRLKTAYGQEAYTLIKAQPGPEKKCSYRKREGISEEGRKKIMV